MTKSNVVGITIVGAEPDVTCADPTVHFASGCELLKHYDENDDGIISSGEVGDALTDRDAGIITEKEAVFVSEAWSRGTIDALCPGCYGEEPSPVLTIEAVDESMNPIVSLVGDSPFSITGVHSIDGTLVAGTTIYVFECGTSTCDDPSLIEPAVITDVDGRYIINLTSSAVVEDTDIYFIASDNDPPA